MLGDVSCTAKPILITAPTPEDAAAIVAALNGTKRLFEKLRDLARQAASSPEEEGEEKDEEQEPATQGEEVDGKHPKGGRIVAVLLKNITEKRLRKRKCRLILRNLSFQATEENISSKLIVFGPLTEVAIARVPVDTGARRDEKSSHRRHNRGGDGVLMKSRGFAFVTFLCESDAKEAVENSSKLRICNREFALDFCESKDRHAASEVTGGNAAGVSASDTSGNASQGNDKDQEKMEEMESSDVEAEDDSSSSSMEEEASDDDDDDAEVDDAEVYGGDDDDAVEEDDDDEGAGEEEEEAGLEDKDENREEVTPKKKSGVTQDVTEGCTVFVRYACVCICVLYILIHLLPSSHRRDLPFDATEDDLKSVFRSFGKLRFAVFVKGKYRWQEMRYIQ
jgi:nucleolar protein 4